MTALLAASRPVAAVLDSAVYVHLRQPQRRRKTEQDPGAKGDRGQINERSGVHREVDPGGPGDARRGGIKPPQPGESDQPTKEASRDRQGQALDQKLPDDASAARADRNANGDFP